jgi:hypothetical protein
MQFSILGKTVFYAKKCIQPALRGERLAYQTSGIASAKMLKLARKQIEATAAFPLYSMRSGSIAVDARLILF